LNLAQAVLLLGYEWMKVAGSATLGRVTTYEAPLAPGLNIGQSQPATRDELEGFFGHMEGELDRLGYFTPPEKRPTMMQNLRAMFTRMGATEQEVRTLRGIVAALAKGKGRGRKAPYVRPFSRRAMAGRFGGPDSAAFGASPGVSNWTMQSVAGRPARAVLVRGAEA